MPDTRLWDFKLGRRVWFREVGEFAGREPVGRELLLMNKPATVPAARVQARIPLLLGHAARIDGSA